MELSQVEIEFIERFGMMSQKDGQPRTLGRIYGLLMLQEGALSLDEMAEGLAISKASVSTNVRRMERLDLVEKIGKRGDRKDYYRIADDAFLDRLERVRQTLRETVDNIHSVMPSIDEEARPRTHQRLHTQIAWHEFMLRETAELESKWRGMRSE